MKADHLNLEEAAAYRERSMTPPDLLAASDHLAGCESCRALFPERPAPDLADSEPISYEEISAWLDNELDPLARKEVARKFRSSFAARAELSDLARFRDEMNEADTARNFPRWILPLAAGLLLAAGISIFTPRATERLEIPTRITELAGKKGTLASLTSQPAPGKLLAPVATAVLSTQPRFQWTAVPNADGYRAQIANEKTGEAISSDHMSTTEWTPPIALVAGEVYQWQIEALRGDEVIARLPVPPEPEAKFAILSGAERAAFEQADLESNSEIGRGLVKAKFGLLDAAAADFATLPNDLRAQKFLEQLNARRRPQ